MFYLFYKLHIFLSKTLLKLKNKSMMDPNYTGLVLRISLRVTEKDAWSKLLCVMDGACEIYVMVNFFMLEAHKLWLVSIWCRYISVGLEDVDLMCLYCFSIEKVLFRNCWKFVLFCFLFLFLAHSWSGPSIRLVFFHL